MMLRKGARRNIIGKTTLMISKQLSTYVGNEECLIVYRYANSVYVVRHPNSWKMRMRANQELSYLYILHDAAPQKAG